MADAIVSVVVERLVATLEEQIRNEVNLVRGVEKEILALSDELKMVKNVLDDAEKKGYKDKSVRDWLKRLEETAYEMDDVLDEWHMPILKHEIEQSNKANVVTRTPRYKVRSCIPSSCLCFKKVVARRDIAVKIKEVKARLDLILAEKDRYGFAITSQPSDPSRESWRVQSTSLIDLEEVCGREFEKENLVSKLVTEGGSREEQGTHVVSIVGVGGLGKTTLAQLAYNDSRVKNCFELRIWICVSDPFDEIEVTKGIIEKAGGRLPNTKQYDMLLYYLRECISRKKILLVMDDVWTEDDTKWGPLKNSLKCGASGSKILVTTRNERVAIMMGTSQDEMHHLGHLSHEECWLLLGRIALSEKNKEECRKFETVGINIAKKCKGLPLAAKTLGSLLRFKMTLEEWENVLNSEIWELEEIEVDLFPHLLLSYNELSPALKRCFSYCAVFPKDTRIDVEKLITEWMAMGYLGSSAGDWKLRGREYFDKLAMRSLFQDFWRGSDSNNQQVRSFKIHDILHDFAQFVRKNVGSRMKKTSCLTCDSLLVAHVQEYRSLFHYKELSDPNICDCLTSVRLLSLRHCHLKRIPKEIEKLIHLRWLDLGCNEFPNKDDLKGICKLYNLQFLWLDECLLKEIPLEIGNLIHLIQLDLRNNNFLKELPESLCNLRELESLDIGGCVSLARLPQGIGKLKNLKHLNNSGTNALQQYPQGLAELTNLVTLIQFHGSKLGWLKNLNRLSGSLELTIELSSGSDDSAVDDAREAELRKKMHIKELGICFSGSWEESAGVDLIDALEPHPNLQELGILFYKGSRLPRWITSPLNQLKSIMLLDCQYLSSLPPLGKLPHLEGFAMLVNHRLKFIGREFLGITTTTTTTTTRSGDPNIEASSSSAAVGTNTSNNIIGFPKLQNLMFLDCSEWKEWEDITEDEDSPAVSIMPSLTELSIISCKGLTKLPHRLLRKVSSSLKVLDISRSTQLEQVYGDRDGQAWKSISLYNPHIDLQQDKSCN